MTQADRTGSEISWGPAREFLHRCLARTLFRTDPADLEDLTQEALVRLLRACRAQEPKNPQALMRAIARRTAIDFIRRRERWKRLVCQFGDAEADSAPAVDPPPDTAGDPLERVRFVVREFFAQRSRLCAELAEAFFAERSWQAVADERRCTSEAIRKQWSRCVKALREAARRGPCVPLQWMREDL